MAIVSFASADLSPSMFNFMRKRGEKVHLGGSIGAPITFLFVDQSSPIVLPNVLQVR